MATHQTNDKIYPDSTCTFKSWLTVIELWLNYTITTDYQTTDSDLSHNAVT